MHTSICFNFLALPVSKVIFLTRKGQTEVLEYHGADFWQLGTQGPSDTHSCKKFLKTELSNLWFLGQSQAHQSALAPSVSLKT